VSENLSTIGIDIGDRYCQLAVLDHRTGELSIGRWREIDGIPFADVP